MGPRSPIAVALAALCAASSARAETSVALGASAEQHALAVAIAGQSVAVRACATGAPCQAAGGTMIAIPAEADADRATIEPIAVGGRRVALVAVPAREGRGRWLALLAAGAASAAPEVLQPLTGFVDRPKGQPGAQQTRVLLREKSGGGEKLSIGSRYENATVCGRPALIVVDELDPVSLDWGRTHARSLESSQRRAAEPLFAQRLGTPFPTAAPRVLYGVVASSALGRDRSGLTDGRLDTAWSENVPGDGREEFLTMTATRDVPIIGFELVLRPQLPAGQPDFRAPRTLFLASDAELFSITLPEDASLQPPGTSYGVTLPAALRTDCLALVLDEAYPQGAADAVTVAELRAVTALDARAPTVTELVPLLDGPRADAEPALALLVRGGEPALAATLAGYGALGPDGQRRALEVIEAGGCEAAGFFVDRLVGRGAGARFDPEEDPVAARARTALRACPQQAREALAKLLLGRPIGREHTLAARELSLVDPSHALATILALFDDADGDRRRELRASLASAARTPSARAAVEQALAADAFGKLSLIARLDLLRAVGPRLAELPGAPAALAAVQAQDDSFRTRYLLLRPAAEIARGGDPAAIALLDRTVRSEPSLHLRAEAARAAASLPVLANALAAALGDREPRVREAALASLSDQPELDAAVEARALGLLAGDPWPFVRVGAARVLGKRTPRAASDEALLAALEDESALVREAVLRSLGARKSSATAERVREVADDAREEVQVRIGAIAALGALCHEEATPLLYKLALRSGAPQLPYDQRLGLAALAALGEIAPDDMGQELAPLLGDKVPGVIRDVVRRTLRGPGSCRR